MNRSSHFSLIITAHEKYLKEPGKTYSLDLLLKPVSRQHLTNILNRLP